MRIVRRSKKQPDTPDERGGIYTEGTESTDTCLREVRRLSVLHDDE